MPASSYWESTGDPQTSMSTVVEWTLAQAVEEGERHFPARPKAALAAVEALFPGIESAGDEALLARCLVLRCNALVHLGRRAEAESAIAAAERRFSATGHERGLVTLLNLRSILAHRASDYPGSIRHLQEALRRARPHGWPEVIANLTGNLGLDLAYLGDYAPALAVLEESLEQWRKVGRSPAMIPTLINLGFTCQRAGAEEAALGHYEEAYQLAVEDEDVPRQAVVLCNLANTLGRLGRTIEARERAR